MQLQLRDYQQKAIDATNAQLAKGVNKQVHVLATGLGKTVIFSHLIDQRNKSTGKRALILAHREELLDQAQEKLGRISDLKSEIEMAEKQALWGDVIIASVPTLGRTDSKRLTKFNPKDFDTIVVDEAHHSSAKTYKNILDYFGVLKGGQDWNKDCLLLGCTATPSRNDNMGIDQIFDEVVFNYGILDGIRDGWLSRIRAYRVDTTTSLEGVKTRAGDFAQDQLADTVNNPERNSLIVKTYLDQFNGKQALVFAVDRDHAKALYEAFKEKGVKAGYVLGNTAKDSRKNDLEAFHLKTIHVMVNCMVLTEGYDNDTIDCIFMARPTKSGILYQQMVGRGTRTHEEKPYLTVVDFVDNTYRHKIQSSASLLGLNSTINFQGRDIVDALPEIEKIQELSPYYNLNNLDFNRLQYIMEEVDLLSGLQIPSDLETLTDFAWHRFGDGFRVSIGGNRYIVVNQSLTGQYTARLDAYNPLTRQVDQAKLGEETSLSDIVQRSDKYIRNNFPDSLRLVSMSAPWRFSTVSPEQANALRRLGVSQDLIMQLNRGQASQLQNKLYAKKSLRGGEL
jgi:ATP-dependent helicase IRC3